MSNQTQSSTSGCIIAAWKLDQSQCVSQILRLIEGAELEASNQWIERKPVKLCIAQVAFKMPAFNSGVSWKWNAHSHTTTVPDYHITTTTSLSQPACDMTHCHSQSLARRWPRDDFWQRPRGLLARPTTITPNISRHIGLSWFIHRIIYPCLPFLSMFIHVYPALQDVSVSTDFVPVAFSEIEIRVSRV